MEFVSRLGVPRHGVTEGSDTGDIGVVQRPCGARLVTFGGPVGVPTCRTRAAVRPSGRIDEHEHIDQLTDPIEGAVLKRSLQHQPDWRKVMSSIPRVPVRGLAIGASPLFTLLCQLCNRYSEINDRAVELLDLTL
jgi:hypothetical protein